VTAPGVAAPLAGGAVRRYVLGFCFDFAYKHVVLIHKLKPDWQFGRLNGVGGKIEVGAGEGAVAAMVREFAEETGGSLGDRVEWRPFGRLRDAAGEWEVWLFHGKYLQEFPADLASFSSDEGSVTVVDRQDLHNWPVLPNLRYLIPMALNHARGLDRAPFFDVVEAPVPDMLVLSPSDPRRLPHGT